MNMTVEDLEKLIAAFQATVPTVESLLKSVNSIVQQNKEFRAKLDEQALLSLIDKNIVESLHEQRMINKSISYMLMLDKELLNEIRAEAHKRQDKELLSYWQRKIS